MAKLTLTAITSRYGSVDALNANFDAIETALENTLSRDGTTPNTMSANLDANGYDILNATNVYADAFYVGGVALEQTALTGSATFNPSSLDDGVGETTTVTVTGAALGDFALASFSVALAGITVTAWVSATNTVSVRFQNESGGTLNLASGTLRVRVIPA